MSKGASIYEEVMGGLMGLLLDYSFYCTIHSTLLCCIRMISNPERETSAKIVILVTLL